MNLRQIVADNIRQLREKRKLTQEDLSILTGMSRTFLGDIERGYKTLTIPRLEKVAKALKVEPYLLLKKNAAKEEN